MSCFFPSHFDDIENHVGPYAVDVTKLPTASTSYSVVHKCATIRVSSQENPFGRFMVLWAHSKQRMGQIHIRGRLSGNLTF